MKLDIRVLGDRDLIRIDGEVLARTTGEAGSRAGRHGALDAFALEAALGQGVPLAEAVGAAPAVEVEAAVGGEAAGAEVAPAPA
jgi:hypothetical protein